jgi:hypothetical protein
MTADERFATARGVADAVLYEGYVLYPYRASSAKNQVRFQWGVLMPPAYCEAEGSERSWARTECLLAPVAAAPGEAGDAVVHVRVRCLQTQRRRVEAAVAAGTAGPRTPADFVPVETLEVDGARHVEWDEAVDRVIDLPPLELPPDDQAVEAELAFTLEGGSETEEVRAEGGDTVGRFVRERIPVEAKVRVTVTPVSDSEYRKVAVAVENTTEWDSGDAARADAMASSLVAVHTMLAADGATFVSLLDPPEDAVDAARGCRSEGTYPVLVGDETVVLSSPIILYDHPEVAEQSPGDLYDSCEIDEILALRVMTLTDAEKAEARGTDLRSAAIIDRCDALSPEAMGRLHGQMRPVEQAEPVEPAWPTLTTPSSEAGEDPTAGGAPWWDPAADASVDPWRDTLAVDGSELGQGSRVRLHPSGRSDAQDMFLDGRSATVAGVFADVDGGFHLAVTLDDDPTAGELVWQGRYLYFHPEEVEPLPALRGAEEPA